MDLSIIIPIYNEEDNLPELIDSIREQIISEDNYEVIFIDSNSNDNSQSIIKDFEEEQENIRLIDYPEPVGPYIPRNVGIEEAENEILVFVDGDCILDEELLEVYHEFFEEEDKAAATGKTEIISDSKMWEIIQEKYDYEAENGSDPLFNTRNAAVLKQVAEELDGFNEDFYRGGDEEFGMRLQENGYEIEFLDNAVIQHRPDRGLIEELKVTYKQGKGEYVRDNERGEVNLLPRFVKAGFMPAQLALFAILTWISIYTIPVYLAALIVFYHWRSDFYTQKPYRNIPFRILYYTLFSTASSLGYLRVLSNL